MVNAPEGLNQVFLEGWRISVLLSAPWLIGESRMTHFQRMTHFPALQLANFFILIGWDILEKVALPYNSAIWRKKPHDNYPITAYLTMQLVSLPSLSTK